jgi:transcriptional regulator with XRE-family HTH domain
VEGDAQLEFGQNLRALRLERDLSQEALADDLGLHRTFIGSVERGERNLTLRTAERLSAALGVDLLTMLGGVPAPAALRAAATGVDPAPRRRARRRPRPEPKGG